MINNGMMIENKNLRDFVFEKLKHTIMSGEFLYGERLVERAVAEKIGVSRTPLREAFRRLEAEGLIETLANGGVVISRFSQDEVRQFYAIRANLEGLAVEWGLDRIVEQDFLQMEDCIINMEKEGNEGNTKEVARYNTDFHNIIMRLSHSPILVSFIDGLKNRMQFIIAQSLSSNALQYKQSVTEHNRILKAMQARDKTEAVAAMREHLLSALDVAINSMRLMEKDIHKDT